MTDTLPLRPMKTKWTFIRETKSNVVYHVKIPGGLYFRGDHRGDFQAMLAINGAFDFSFFYDPKTNDQLVALRKTKLEQST